MCPTGKRGYASEDSALEAMRTMNRENPRRHEARVYLCEHCTQYHLTSQPKKVKK